MKKKFKILNKKVLSIALVFALGIGINNVYAEDGVLTDGAGGSAQKPSQPDTSEELTNGVNALKTNNTDMGIRISFVDKDGAVFFSRTYVSQSVLEKFRTADYIPKLNRPKFKSNTETNSGWVSGTENIDDADEDSYTYGEINIEPISNFVKSFESGYEPTIDGNIQNLNYNVDVLFSRLYRKNHLNEKYEDYLSKVQKSLKNFICKSNTNICEDFTNKLINEQDIFIVYEPVMYATIDKKTYVGSSYELSKIAEVKKASGAYSWCAGSDAYCDIGVFIGTTMSCSVRLSGSLSAIKNTDAPTLVKNNFSANSYFGGKILISDYAKDNQGVTKELTACDDKSFRIASSEVTSKTTSIGLGVLWIGNVTGDEFGETTCAEVKKDLNIIQNYKEDFGESIQNFRNQYSLKFIQYKNKNKISTPTNFSADWYYNNCLLTKDITIKKDYDCTPKISVNNCKSGTNQAIYYLDSSNGIIDDDYWNICVFNNKSDEYNVKYNINEHKKTGDKNSSDYYDDKLSNDYCEVYCIESIDGRFDNSTPIVLAGNNFVWGYSVVSSSRTCKTKSIDFAKFQKDINTKNGDVAQAYADKLAIDEFNNGSWSVSETNTCPTSGGDKIYASSDAEYAKNYDIPEDMDPEGTDSGGPYVYCFKVNGECKRKLTDDTVCVELDGDKCVTGYTNKTQPTQYIYNFGTNNKIEKNISYREYDGTTKYKTAEIEGPYTSCGTSMPTEKPKLNLNTNVSAAIEKVKEAISTFNSCFDFNNDWVINEKSESELTYLTKLNKYGFAGRDMGKKIVPAVNSDDCITTKKYNISTSCENGICSGEIDVKQCAQYTKTVTKYSTYYLSDDTYQYIIKDPISSEFKLPVTDWINYIDVYSQLHHGILPVAYNEPTGLHQDSLKIKYDNLGHISESGKVTANQVIKTYDSSYGLWSCDYNVTSGLLCENGDCINVIYREIDLARPFPNIDNSNRDTGTNWCAGSDCSWNNNIVQKYILNNRNVTGNDVYNQTPMYTFIMKPSDIIEIRKYNDSNSYDDTNYKCNEGTGNACISDYLTHLLEILESYDNPGTCKDAKTRAYTDVTSFNNCRY